MGLHDFAYKNMLQFIDLARFLFAHTEFIHNSVIPVHAGMTEYFFEFTKKFWRELKVERYVPTMAK